MKFVTPKCGEKIFEISEPLIECKVIERRNRFLCSVEKDGERLSVHLHDPGRLKELIYPGSKVKIRKTNGVKTKWSITFSMSHNEEILLDTRFHNGIARQFIGDNCKPEVKRGDTRFDFGLENGFVEVKGCTMLVNNHIIFPDAPSKRGSKHLRELSTLSENGYDCSIIFLILRKNGFYFYPNSIIDPDFESAFLNAIDRGVKMYFPRMSFANGELRYFGNASYGDSPFSDIEFYREFQKVTGNRPDNYDLI